MATDEQDGKVFDSRSLSSLIKNFYKELIASCYQSGIRYKTAISVIFDTFFPVFCCFSPSPISNQQFNSLTGFLTQSKNLF